MYDLKISHNVCNEYLFTCTHLKFKSSRLPRKFWKSYNEKLDNSFSRAKNTIFNICQFNKFYYFFTLTINSCYDRKDLISFVKKFNNVVKYLNKKSNTKDFYYLFVPELHEDNTNFHIHGFLSEAFKQYEYINRNGFPGLTCFKKLGFDSISKIKNYMACVNYCCKYICKDIINKVKGAHLYYCSNGLLRDNVISVNTFTQIPPIHFDFKSMYCFKTKVDVNKYYNFITSIANNELVMYYDYS